MLNKYGGMLFFCVFFMYSGCALSYPCKNEQLKEELKRTSAYVVFAAPIVEHYDVLRAGTQHACAILSFKIDANGKAKEWAVEESHPATMMDRVAVKTLKKYKFKAPEEGVRNERFYLYFEILINPRDNNS